jgi:hypothetical protein
VISETYPKKLPSDELIRVASIETTGLNILGFERIENKFIIEQYNSKNTCTYENGQGFRLNLDNGKSMEDDLSVEIVNYQSEGGMLGESELEVTREVDAVTINGLMTANTGGHEPVVKSVSVHDGILKVFIGLKQPEDIATQVISSYEYTARVKNLSNYTGIEVEQKGGQSKKLKL